MDAMKRLKRGLVGSYLLMACMFVYVAVQLQRDWHWSHGKILSYAGGAFLLYTLYFVWGARRFLRKIQAIKSSTTTTLAEQSAR